MHFNKTVSLDLANEGLHGLLFVTESSPTRKFYLELSNERPRVGFIFKVSIFVGKDANDMRDIRHTSILRFRFSKRK